MWQAAGGVTLELDAFFEIDQVEFDLLGTAPQRQVRNDHVEERGFARAGLAGDQTMLTRAFSNGQVLQLGGAGAANWHAQLAGGVLAPNLRFRGNNLFERHFDPARIAAAAANLMDELTGLLRRWRRLDDQVRSRDGFAGQDKSFAFVLNANAAFSQFVRHKILRQRLAVVPMNQAINPAPRATGGDTQQAFGGRIAEVHGKISHDQEMIFLGDHAGLFVVFGNGLIFIAQIHLDDFFHVLVQVPEPLLDLAGLGPNPAIDELLLIIGQVHHAGETLSQPNRVDDREIQPSGRSHGKQPQNNIVERANYFITPRLGGFKQDGSPLGIRQQERQREAGRSGQRQQQTFVGSRCFRELFRIDVQLPEFRRLFELRRRRPGRPTRRVPGWE